MIKEETAPDFVLKYCDLLQQEQPASKGEEEEIDVDGLEPDPDVEEVED